MKPLRILLALLAFAAPLSATAQTAPEPFAQEIAAFAAADAKAMPAPGGVLFLGSSSIRLWTTLSEDFPGMAVLNRGFGGSTIPDSIRYADRIVLPYKPKTIVFYAGDNDIEAGHAPSQVLADFKALVRKVHGTLPRTRILFIAIKPSIARWSKIDRIAEANRLVEAYIRTDKRLGYVDIVPAMLGPDGKPRPELLRADGLHMTAAGYASWRDKVGAVLK